MELSRAWVVACVVGIGIATVLSAACTSGSTMTKVSWDLRSAHDRAAVGWQGSSPGFSVPDADATILLPGERTFRAQGVSLDLTARGAQVTILAIMYPPSTIDAGYALAKRVAVEWGLRTDLLENWHQEVLANRQAGKRDSDESFNVGMAGPSLAPSGPTPFARVLQSFDPERPFRLDLEFQWV